MKVINKKSFFTPYKKINNKHVIIMFDYQPILKEGKETLLASWEEYRFNHVPDIHEIKRVVLEYFNKQINEEIISNFEWNGLKVWLSTENQINYKSAYDLAIQTHGANLPLIFKFENIDGSVYHKFETLEEFSDFYIKTLQYIQKTLQKGWEKKDNIKWEIFR
jgi:hypothetical protein